MNYSKISNLILRWGLALTYFYSGFDLIAHPTSWSVYVPYWFANLLPVEVTTFIQFQGGIEILMALAFVSGYFLRPAAFLSAVEMVAILILYGIDAVTFRDLAILGGSLAIFMQTFSPNNQPQKAVAAAPETAAPVSKTNLTDSQKRLRIILVASAFILFSIILIGLFWLSNTTKDQAGWLAFSYATGLSMIVLPCTLPLAFVIVPLAMGKDPKKGLGIAFAFALGVTITLSMYGALIAKLGAIVGLDQAKDTMYLIAGVFAVVFGFGELGLIKMRVPTYAGAFPKFIQDRKDAFKGLLLGLLLGNVGLGCPNPAFYVLLSHIATVGSMSTGWFLTFIHAIGRVTPLILLAILAVLGVDALSVLMKRREALTRVTAWGVVGVGAFILTFGLLGHDWYVYSGIHSVLELVTQEASFVTSYADKFGGIAHAHGMPTGKYLGFGNWLFVSLIVLPLIWNWRKRKKEVDQSNPEAVRTYKWFGAYTIVFSMFLYLLFSVYLPSWYRYQVVPSQMHEDHGGMTTSPDGHAGHGAVDPSTVGAEVKMIAPTNIRLNRATALEFQVIDKTTNTAITNLEISHGEPMHVVGVRKEDMTQFFHIHPEVRGDKYVVNHTFTQPGTYLIWPGIVFGGVHLSPQMPELVVGAPPVLSYIPSLERIKRFNSNLVVQLKSADELHAGMSHQLGFAVTDAGGFDVPVGEYLEENMHINIVSQDGTYYNHLHTNYGMIGGEGATDGHNHTQAGSRFSFIPVAQAQVHDNADGHHGPGEVIDESHLFTPKDLRIAVTFPKAGMYKVFGEFVTVSNPNRVNVVEYWVNVSDPLPESKGGGFNKWLLAAVSIIIIAAIMPLIFRYLKEDKIKV